MDSPSTSTEGIRRPARNRKVVNDEDDDIIYAFKRYVHVRKERKERRKDWNYELNEVDNRDVRGNERRHEVSEEIREAAERDRNRRRTRGGAAVTYSDPLVTQTDGLSTATSRSRKDDNYRSEYRSRDPQKGIYDHPFYRNHRQKRSQSETNLLSNKQQETRIHQDQGKERRASLRPGSTKGHQQTELPTASFSGQSLSKYKKTKKSGKGEKTVSKKDDTSFMLIGGTYANSL